MQIDKIKLAIPRLKHDKIIGTLSGTISVPAVSSPSFSVSASATHNTAFGDSCLFEGIYSDDGGATWNDMGAMIPNLSDPSQPVFQTLDCQPSSAPNGIVTITCTNYTNPVTGFSPAKTIQYKLALIAKKNQLPLTPLPIPAQPVRYSSRFNYQKIYLDDTVTFTATAGNTGQATVNHNLGYVPNMRFWLVNGGTISLPAATLEVRVGNNDITFFYDNYFEFVNKTFTILYRVYYDA